MDALDVAMMVEIDDIDSFADWLVIRCLYVGSLGQEFTVRQHVILDGLQLQAIGGSEIHYEQSGNEHEHPKSFGEHL